MTCDLQIDDRYEVLESWKKHVRRYRDLFEPDEVVVLFRVVFMHCVEADSKRRRSGRAPRVDVASQGNHDSGPLHHLVTNSLPIITMYLSPLIIRDGIHSQGDSPLTQSFGA